MPLGRWRRTWPGSLRGRLTLACTALAAFVGAAGLALFALLLHRGVNASVDAVLEARATRVIDGLRAERPSAVSSGLSPSGIPGTAATPGPSSRTGHEFDSFTVVYGPDGGVVTAEPAAAVRLLADSHAISETRQASSHLTINEGGEPIRLLARPVALPGGTWVVAVGTSLTPASSAADRALRDLDIGVPVLVALAGVGAWLLAGASLRPVERMRVDAVRLGDGHLSGRITVPATTGELARLATTFNSLLDRAETSLERQRKFVADTGHELRTPLAVLRTELELADNPGSSRDDLAEAISHARQEAERLSKLADDMLFLARADSDSPIVHRQAMDLRPVLYEAVRAHRAPAEAAMVEVAISPAGPLWVDGDAAALRRVVDNLLNNCLAVTPAGGRIAVAARQSGHEVVVEVTDTGPGFPVEFLPHAFERFTRPDPARPSGRHGAGLGLAIVAEIAGAHGGHVQAANLPGGGARVAMVLPAAEPVPDTAEPAPASRPGEDE